MGFHTVQTLEAIFCSVCLIPAVWVVRVGRHPARQNVIASSGSILNALIAQALQLGQCGGFDLTLFSLPRYERDKLKNEFEDGEPAHAAGLFAGKK